jgi:ribosomal protein S20
MSVKEQRKNKIRQIRNKKYRTLVNNQLKKVTSYFQGNQVSAEELKKMVAEAQKALDKASNKKVITKKKINRKKSKLHKLVQWEKIICRRENI